LSSLAHYYTIMINNVQFLTDPLQNDRPIRQYLTGRTIFQKAFSEIRNITINYFSRVMRIGTSLVNAYNVEKCQEWMGAAISPELEQYIGEKTYLRKWKVPTKDGILLNYAVDWTELLDNRIPLDGKNEKIDIRHEIEKIFLSIGDIGDREKIKLKNSLAFCEKSNQ
jgi:hypothetical protein